MLEGLRPLTPPVLPIIPAAKGLTAEVPPKSSAQVLLGLIVEICGIPSRPLLKIVERTAEHDSRNLSKFDQ